MKPAEIDHEDLLEAVQSLRGAVKEDSFRFCSSGKRSFLEAVSPNLRIQAGLSVRGSSFDVSLPYSSFQKLAKLFRSPLSAWVEGESLVLEEGERRVSLVARETEDDRPGPEWTAPREFLETDGKQFRATLQDALRAASSDPGRPVLCTVALTEIKGKIRLVATDSFRLLSLPLPGDVQNALPRPLLLPRDMTRSLVADMQRVKPEKVFIEYGEEDGHWGATIAYNSVTWHFVSPEGQYPDWQDLLRASGNTLEISRDEIKGMLRFVEALAGKGKPEQNGSTALRFDLGEEVHVRFQRPGLGEVSQVLERSSWRGSPQTLGVNPLFLADMLDVLDGEKLQGQASDSSGGMVFSGRGDARYLLMPVRLPELAE